MNRDEQIRANRLNWDERVPVHLESGADCYDRETPEARFAAAMDRLGPIMQNCFDNGHAWKKHGVTADRVLATNRRIEEGSRAVWEYARSLIEQAVGAGDLKKPKT